jgi:hypothetical protein
VVVNTIAATRTRTGLRVEAALDTRAYPLGVSVSAGHIATLPIAPHIQRVVVADPWRLLPRRPASDGTAILARLAFLRVQLVLADSGMVRNRLASGA